MTVPKDCFINPCCFGDDLAEWIIDELRRIGIRADEKPGQEDFGWYLNFDVAGIQHTLVIGHRPTGETEEGIWIGWLERRRGFLQSILGGRSRGIELAAVEAIHQVLSHSPLITNVRWHSRIDFGKGREEGSESPQ